VTRGIRPVSCALPATLPARSLGTASQAEGAPRIIRCVAEGHQDEVRASIGQVGRIAGPGPRGLARTQSDRLAMARLAYRHIAITVPNLEEAESYYRRLFDMDVVTREALMPDGARQLPPENGWADAQRAGIDLDMLALRRGSFVLALFDEAAAAFQALAEQPRRPLFVGLTMDSDEISALRERLGPDEAWDDDSGGFRDRYGIVWQPSSTDAFVGSGEGSGRWLDV
jgi:catechol 2,3-dioxygenase-like lactoylglutathione lyase family enzyme